MKTLPCRSGLLAAGMAWGVLAGSAGAEEAPAPAKPPPSRPEGQPTGKGPKLAIAGERFTLNGKPTFLLGVSYFDGRFWRASDLDALAARRFNLIRIWLDWADRGFFDKQGNLAHAPVLLELVRACAARGIVLDVTILCPGITFDPARRETAVRATVTALKKETNVFYDIMNEHDHGGGPISHADVAALIRAARAADPNAIVTVSSCGGHLEGGEKGPNKPLDEELAAGIRVLTPHLSRSGDWFAQSGPRVARMRAYLASKGKPMPIYLQEEARRGHSGLNPSKAEFVQAAVGARDAGAGAWLLHTAAGFKLNEKSFFDSLDAEERETMDALGPAVFGSGKGPAPKMGK